jgi:membrane protein YqaA with SNARE-associated domain
VRSALRAIAGIALAFAAVAAAGYWLRPQLQSWGTSFIERFGIAGMGLGSFLADAIHFPVPPQFYMLAAIAAGHAQAAPLAAICAGSLTGDVVALGLGRMASRFPAVRRRLDPTRRVVEDIIAKHGTLAAFFAGISPLSFALQCNVAGLYRLERRFTLMMLAFRLPRLLFFYLVLRLGWVSTA